jgi:hypothetical protein
MARNLALRQIRLLVWHPLALAWSPRLQEYAVALDPDLVRRYNDAHQAYDVAVSAASQRNDPAVIEAREEYREALAAYVLDLEVNGISVPPGLNDELANLTDSAGDPDPQAPSTDEPSTRTSSG